MTNFSTVRSEAAVVLLTGALNCCAFSAAGADSFTTAGIVEQSYTRANGTRGILSNWFHVTVSDRRSLIRTGGMMDEAIDYFEYTSDGTNSALLIKYNTKRKVRQFTTPTGKNFTLPENAEPVQIANEATLIINSGLVPEYGFGLITPIWLAYASRPFFEDNHSNTVVEPITFMGSGFRENGLKVLASWKLEPSGSGFLSQMETFSDGYSYGEEHGTPLKTRLPAPFNKPCTNAVFQVTSWTNFGSLRVPHDWELILFSPDLDKETIVPRSLCRGAISSVDITNVEINGIGAIEHTRIIDRTLKSKGLHVREYTYMSTNGHLLSTDEIKKRPGFREIFEASQRERSIQKKRWLAVATIIGFLSFPIALFLRRAWGKEKSTNN